jgi:hypothetical protein
MLGSLRARLLRRTIVSPSMEVRKRSEDARDMEYYKFYERFLDARDLVASQGGAVEISFELTIPRDARISREYDREQVQWLIEVWGRVRFWPGFMHQ